MKESTIKVVRDERGRFVKPTHAPRPFQVGDVVKISKTFNFAKYGSHRNNPKGGIGVIRKIRSKSEIIHGANEVDWNTGGWNTYWDDELDLVPNAPKQRKAEKKAEAPKFKVGDRVRVTKGKYVPNGTLGTIEGKCFSVKGAWYVRYDSGPEPRLRYAMPDQIEKVKDESKGLDLTVPEEIPAALQTLAKAFGYRVEKA